MWVLGTELWRPAGTASTLGYLSRPGFPLGWRKCLGIKGDSCCYDFGVHRGSLQWKAVSRMSLWEDGMTAREWALKHRGHDAVLTYFVSSQKGGMQEKKQSWPLPSFLLLIWDVTSCLFSKVLSLLLAGVSWQSQAVALSTEAMS